MTRSLGARDSLPIVAARRAALCPTDLQQLETLAARLLQNEAALDSTSAFGVDVKAGVLEGPALLISDVREIGLASPPGSAHYEYRLAALAADGDTLLISGHRSAAFERYRRDVLGLGLLDVLILPPDRHDGLTPLATRCANRAHPLGAIAAKARAADGMTILPHIGMGSAWRLAGAIAERAGTPVRVAAPPPRLTRRVNDKVWFARRVAETLGMDAHSAYRSVYGPASLAGHFRRLARSSDRVVVKIPDSAGSAGNLSISGADVRERSLAELRKYLLSVLGEVGWRGRYPLLVEVWDAPVLANPSVQIWIPARIDGSPVPEGMYEQMVIGAAGTFIGSVPAYLPNQWSERVTHDAFKLATLFQYLGYFGRCSFDAIITGNNYAEAALHWVECNGRWGGVSIPMTLANRLTRTGERKVFIVIQLTGLDFEPLTIDQVQDILGDDLFRPHENGEGVVLVSPFGLETGYGVNLMAIAGSVRHAEEIARRATRQVTGMRF